VTLDAKGEIARWETTLAESALRTPKEPETASVAELEERATKAAAAEEAARKREAKKAAAGKKAAPKKAPAKAEPKKAPPKKAAVGTKTKKK
jgi:nucleoid-associated protein YgaU